MDLNQVSLAVRNFGECVGFYQKIGLKLIVLSEGRYARFEMPSGSTTLSISYAETCTIGSTVLYFEVDDVDRRFSELTALGVEFESAPTDESWKWREARFSDPAGNKLCLFHAGPNRRFPPWRLETD
jgi:catechol 2,3-dioxygenase-like lactoylglutathione lyase family enzyme